MNVMNSPPKKLVCGPYVGEFGWEIFSWSGYCRTLSQHFDETVVVTRPGRDFLYSDFAEVTHFSPPPGISDCEKHSAVSQELAASVIVPLSEKNNGAIFWLPPFQNVRGAYQHWSEPLFIDVLKGFLKPSYAVRDRDLHPTKLKILLHARHRPDVRPEDDMVIGDFLPFVHAIKDSYELCSIGSTDSVLINGTRDLRNISLDKLAEHMDESLATIGPSSGPIHFASLVDCPIITWHHDSNKNWARYATNWNPLSASVIFVGGLQEKQTPSVDMLLDSVTLLEKNSSIIMRVVEDKYS